VVAGRTAAQDSEDSDGSDSDGETERRNQVIDAELRQMNAAKKASFKATFDKKYDEKELVSAAECFELCCFLVVISAIPRKESGNRCLMIPALGGAWAICVCEYRSSWATGAVSSACCELLNIPIAPR
jgi:hypothetical protein